MHITLKALKESLICTLFTHPMAMCSTIIKSLKLCNVHLCSPAPSHVPIHPHPSQHISMPHDARANQKISQITHYTKRQLIFHRHQLHTLTPTPTPTDDKAKFNFQKVKNIQNLIKLKTKVWPIKRER